MPLRDHEAITISDFRGYFDRGEDESVPQGYFSLSRNNRYFRGGCKTREGSSVVHTITSVRRAKIYKRIGEAQRLLILDATGKLYDSTNLASPILEIATMSDFSSVTMYNRAYITPHDGVTGLPGEKIYVYNGSGTARPAAGAAPTGFILALTNSAVSGTVEEGTHLVGVAFESDTGYITAPGGFQQINATGGKKLNVDLLPIGPAGTVARIIIVTPIVDFNGDFQHQTYFFAPNGRVADNTTTTLNDTLDFYDADLEEEASFLLDQMDEIPAGVGIGKYGARLIIWGEDANPSIIRVSVDGEPEAHSAVDGFVTINPGDSSTGLKYCFGYTPLLICQKSNRTYYTQDNGDVAALWSVPDAIDTAIGAGPHSVAQVLDYGERLENLVVTAHKTGIRVYDGTLTQTPLTFNIDDFWSRITKTAFNKVELIIDANNYALFALLPIDGATTPNFVLYGDFNEGLNFESIKWDIWKFPNDPHTIVADVSSMTEETVIKFGSLDGNIYKLDDTVLNDYGNFINANVKFGSLPIESDGGILHFTGCRLRVVGSGILSVQISNLDNTSNVNGQALTLSAAPGRSLFSGFNATAERGAVKLFLTTIDTYYKLTRFSLFVNQLWETRGA